MIAGHQSVGGNENSFGALGPKYSRLPDIGEVRGQLSETSNYLGQSGRGSRRTSSLNQTKFRILDQFIRKDFLRDSSQNYSTVMTSKRRLKTNHTINTQPEEMSLNLIPIKIKKKDSPKNPSNARLREENSSPIPFSASFQIHTTIQYDEDDSLEGFPAFRATQIDQSADVFNNRDSASINNIESSTGQVRVGNLSISMAVCSSHLVEKRYSCSTSIDCSTF